jgi:glycosyltransferase involved in cell wall biosynthesis
VKVVMFVTNPFTSDPRVYAEAKSLVQAGYEVTVIAWDTGRHHPARQNWDGINIVRVTTPLASRPGSAWLLWNRLNFYLWQRRAFRQTLALNRENRLDVIHCHDFDTLAIGTRLKSKLGLPLVYDAHEIYGYMVAENRPRWIPRILLWQEKRLVKKVDRIINVSEARKRYFESITDKPISVIMNCKPLQSLEYQPPNNEKFTVLYIGGLYQDRGVLMLVHAAKELPGVQCLIGGIGFQDYVQTVKEECSRTSNVTFLGRVPFEEVIPMTQRADCIFWMLSLGNFNNITGLGNKQFEAMACGRPIICTKGTYSGEVTEQEEVGLAVEYNEQALKEAIVKLRDDPELRQKLGRNALKAAIAKYNWQKQEEKLLALYQTLRI